MAFLGASVVKDLRRYRRDPWALLTWLGIPLFIGLLFSLAFGGDDGPSPRVELLVVDQDDSLISGFLVGALGSDRMQLVDAESVEETSGRERIADGDGSALLVIPTGFGDALLRETPITLELVTNPSQSVLPGIAEELLSIMADVVFYLHRVVGDDIRELVSVDQSTLDDARVAAVSVLVNDAIRNVAEFISPPLIRVEAAATAGAEEATTAAVDVGRLFLPGILFMALLFISQGLAGDIWQERELHTLRRVATTPNTLHAVLAAKIAAAAVIIAIVCAIAILVASARYGVSLRIVPIAVLWSTLTGIMLLALQLVIHVHARSSRAANLISLAIIFPLMMMGGSFFPFEAMPSWMVTVGRLTPNGWALVRLKEIAWGEPAVTDLLMGAALLIATTAGLLYICGRRLRTSFATG